MSLTQSRSLTLTAVCCLFFGLSSSASADLIIDYSTTYNGTGPSFSGPYIEVDFHTIATGDVLVTVTDLAPLSSGLFVDQIGFNVDPSITSVSSIDYVSGLAVSKNGAAFDVNGITVVGAGGPNQGSFDLILDYPNGSSKGLIGGLSSTYEIKGAGLTAESFDVLNGKGLLSLAHVGGYDDGNSAAISGVNGATPVPEPSSLVIMTTAIAPALGLLWNHRRKLRKRDADPTKEM